MNMAYILFIVIERALIKDANYVIFSKEYIMMKDDASK